MITKVVDNKRNALVKAPAWYEYLSFYQNHNCQLPWLPHVSGYCVHFQSFQNAALDVFGTVRRMQVTFEMHSELLQENSEEIWTNLCPKYRMNITVAKGLAVALDGAISNESFLPTQNLLWSNNQISPVWWIVGWLLLIIVSAISNTVHVINFTGLTRIAYLLSFFTWAKPNNAFVRKCHSK